LRRLGSSVDWSRERFTMDDRCAKAVTEAFVRFHEAGIMYRASRLVNWSCALKSAISDLEVDHLELNGGELRTVPGHGSTKYQFAMFAEFAYKVVDSDEEVVVATTRLETMLGDVAVAVHPKDPRYKHLHGKKLRHPFFPSREVTVVTDDILVDMAKGTGCVKVTPAHDPHDYECGKRHSLPFMTIFSLDGRVVHQATPFSVTGQGDYPVEVFPSWIAGQMRYDARVLVEKKLDELGLLRGNSERPMTLAVCSRSGDIIEPLVQPQWFVDCSKPAKRACDAVRDGSLRIRPKMHERTWFKWRVPRRRSGPSTRPWRRRLQQTRSWLVSFSISRPFGPRRGRVDGVGATREPRRRRHAPRNAGSRT
jgi:valyl-tRNA synthetase